MGQVASILAATILIAGIFAFMPVEKASTVHTSLTASRLIQDTVSLNGVDVGSVGVVADTTPNGMGTVNIAATLPVAEAGAADTCEPGVEAPLVTVAAGQAGVALPTVFTAADNTGITGRLNIGGGFGATDDMCVFHRTITIADTPGAGLLTDIVVIGAVGALPADAYITVTGNVLT